MFDDAETRQPDAENVDEGVGVAYEDEEPAQVRTHTLCFIIYNSDG